MSRHGASHRIRRAGGSSTGAISKAKTAWRRRLLCKIARVLGFVERVRQHRVGSFGIALQEAGYHLGRPGTYGVWDYGLSSTNNDTVLVL